MDVLTLLACATLRDVLPGPPALDAGQRAEFDQDSASDVHYTGPPSVLFPVLPVQIWGLSYALDLVLVSDHPDWVMHEYARVELPDGPAWIAKDAGVDREQFITADIDGIQAWVPEVPVRRARGAVAVTDRSTGPWTDISLAYVNPLGQAVHVDYRGRTPTKPSNPRNGNTMGHSRASVAALLDLYLFRVGGRAGVTIDGVHRRLHRLLGVLPEAYLLAQTQGGFAVADFAEHPREGGFSLVRDTPGWPTRSDEAWDVPGEAAHRDGYTALTYDMPGGELRRATVEQGGHEVARAVFSPAVPDLRRRFEGVVEGRFAVDVGELRGNGVGSWRARWEGDTAILQLLPEAPAWFADRPMTTTVRAEGDGVRVVVRRVDPSN